MLNPVQTDAVLDVLRQCQAVGAAYDQKKACKCGGGNEQEQIAAKATSDFQAALTTLGDLATHAEDELDVPDKIIQSIFYRYLPTALVKETTR